MERIQVRINEGEWVYTGPGQKVWMDEQVVYIEREAWPAIGDEFTLIGRFGRPEHYRITDDCVENRYRYVTDLAVAAERIA